MANCLFLFDLNFIIRQLKDHDSLPGVVSFKQIVTFDLIVELQLVHGHQVGNVLVRRIIEEQKDFPRAIIPGFDDPCHHFMKDFHRKGVEEIAPIDFSWNFILKWVGDSESRCSYNFRQTMVISLNIIE